MLFGRRGRCLDAVSGSRCGPSRLAVERGDTERIVPGSWLNNGCLAAVSSSSLRPPVIIPPECQALLGWNGAAADSLPEAAVHVAIRTSKVLSAGKFWLPAQDNAQRRSDFLRSAGDS